MFTKIFKILKQYLKFVDLLLMYFVIFFDEQLSLVNLLFSYFFHSGQFFKYFVRGHTHTKLYINFII